MSNQHFMVARRCEARVTKGLLARRMLGVALIASALAGCTAYRVREQAEVPNDYRKRHQIALREGARSMELFVGQSRGSLNATQRADVMAFAHGWRQDSTGGIVIEVPRGTPNQHAAAQASREVSSLLMASGMPPQTVAVRAYQPESPAQLPTVRLAYSAIKADAGPCGLWPTDLGPSPEPFYATNKPYWNLGCSNQRNLAAMVDNPADLVQPRGETPAFTARRTMVLEKYRAGMSPETTYPNADKNRLSEVGN